jgi:hypothetical protein
MARAYSVSEARKVASDPSVQLVWVDEREHQKFREPGWIELQPHRDGAVLYVRRQRDSRAG